MPFFISSERLEQLHAENESLQARLEQVDHLRPHLELAVMLKDQVVDLLDEQPYLTAQQIGDLAFRLVLEKQIEGAREEVVASYEQEHRRSLYERVVQKVDEEEGDDIFNKVKEKVETDPELARELHDSARQEIAARALSEISATITTEQEEILEAETERQLALDRLDVELAIEGELDLHRDDINELLEPGDQLNLHYEEYGRTAHLTFTRQRDVNGTEGWVLASKTTPQLRISSGYAQLLRSDRFTEIGTNMPDLQQGRTMLVPNELRVGHQLGFRQTVEGREVSFAFSNEWNAPIGKLTACDFKTKQLHFV